MHSQNRSLRGGGLPYHIDGTVEEILLDQLRLATDLVLVVDLEIVQGLSLERSQHLVKIRANHLHALEAGDRLDRDPYTLW